MSARYLFGGFLLSPSRRLLLREGREVPLVPRYLDLLLLLIRSRDRAVTRGEMMDAVWSDVVVSDGALSQAVRTLRRALGDDPRNARFIRTVSRHGYQFVFSVVEEDDGDPLPRVGGTSEPVGAGVTAETADADEAPSREDDRAAPAEPGFDALFTELVSEAPEEARRIAAESLHALGTARAVERLRERPGSAKARALLRDARWDLAVSGPVPIFGEPEALATIMALVSLRLRRVLKAAGSRYASAVGGAAIAGLVAGLAGALALFLPASSSATGTVLVLLPLIGGAIAATGAAGVAAGLCCAEVLVRSRRGLALVLFGAAGGGLIGSVAHALGLVALQGLFGQDLSPVAGGLEGIVIGAATGLGYALATPLAGGGLATPQGGSRWRVALAAGAVTAAATALLSATGSYLGAMSLNLLAQRFPGSQVSLDPLARLLGETTPGPVTRITVGAFEGLMFASGTILGLTRRPRERAAARPH